MAEWNLHCMLQFHVYALITSVHEEVRVQKRDRGREKQARLKGLSCPSAHIWTSFRIDIYDR